MKEQQIKHYSHMFSNLDNEQLFKKIGQIRNNSFDYPIIK